MRQMGFATQAIIWRRLPCRKRGTSPTFDLERTRRGHNTYKVQRPGLDFPIKPVMRGPLERNHVPIRISAGGCVLFGVNIGHSLGNECGTIATVSREYAPPFRTPHHPALKRRRKKRQQAPIPRISPPQKKQRNPRPVRSPPRIARSPEVVEAVAHVRQAENLATAPLLAMGASSGGAPSR